MSNLFNQLGGNHPVQQNQNNQAQPHQMDMNKAFQQFRQNPVEFLLKAKFNIPDNIPKDPASIGQYLLQSGQINQNQIAQARMMMGRR